MKLPTLAKARENLMVGSPSLIAFGYVILERQPQSSWLETLISAVVSGFAIFALGFIAYAVIYQCLSYVLGRPDPYKPAFESMQSLIAGVLLATGVWIWWQENKANTIDAIAACVDEQRAELDRGRPSGLVKSCYRMVSNEPVDQ